ncbi:unnamed protein product [Rhizoctonia solani]|uniref:SUN domain-containing protein n=1 Tax=Rhizoctonia solani TaxID=456999 RepID=A0A8H3HYM3_9AGAM|nr:unnamed protein product [Rhizoctonia solani]
MILLIGLFLYILNTNQWFVRRSANYYQFEDCLYGRSIVPDNPTPGTRVNLGRYPINWEILSYGANEYLIKLVGYDLILDQHFDNEIHCWPRDGDAPQKRWKFERLSDITDDALKLEDTSAMPMKDNLFARLTERLEQKDSQLVTLNRVIHEQREVIERGAKELARVREELNVANARLAERDEFNGAAANAPPSNPSQSEIASWREELNRLESLLNNLSGESNQRSNNLS